MPLPWVLTSFALIIAATALVFFVVQRRRSGDHRAMFMMQEQLNGMRQEVGEQVRSLNQTIHESLQNTVKVTQESQHQVANRLDNAARVIGEVQNRLGKVEQANQRIYEVGKDIASLQEILRAPKLRGSLGELFLGDLLAQIMPAEHFSLQYRFKSGEAVDAVVKLSGKLVPIDAKFPLENFKKFVGADAETDKKASRRLFMTDVKKHVDAIASKYIRPDEQTFDFALMYIPAENVYYETIIKDDEFGGEKALCHYAMEKKVVPVSPNNFYAYLNTILLGLRGFKLEKSIEEVIANMARLKGDFDRFANDFSKLGTHLNHARSSFDQADKRLERFHDKLNSLDVASHEEPVRVLKGGVTS